MKCPRCAAFSRLDTPACLHCGFQMSDLFDRLGQECVLIHRVTDSVNCLKQLEKQAITLKMDQIEDLFPQIFLCVFVAEIPPTLSLAEFGFWLGNHAAVTDVDYTRPNENGVFLILDILGHRSSISAGYLIEQFLPESAQLRALRKGSLLWEEKKLGKGIETCLTELEHALIKSAKRFAKAVPAPWDEEDGDAPAELRAMGLRPIREGHTMPERDAEPLSDEWWEGKE